MEKLGEKPFASEEKVGRPWPKVAPCFDTTWRRFDEKQRTSCFQRNELYTAT